MNEDGIEMLDEGQYKEILAGYQVLDDTCLMASVGDGLDPIPVLGVENMPVHEGEERVGHQYNGNLLRGNDASELWYLMNFTFEDERELKIALPLSHSFLSFLASAAIAGSYAIVDKDSENTDEKGYHMMKVFKTGFNMVTTGVVMCQVFSTLAALGRVQVTKDEEDHDIYTILPDHGVDGLFMGKIAQA